MDERPGESAHGGLDPARRAPGRPEARTWTLDRASLAQVDRLAAEEFGLPGLVLMENAAAGLARHALAALHEADRRDVAIVCGPGNNGGDGLAAARHLHNAGASVLVVLLGEPQAYQGDAATNLAIVRAMGLPVHPLASWNPDEHDAPALVIDAVFGTGLTRPIDGLFRDAVLRINRLGGQGSRIIAADLPSGLDADSGFVVGDEHGLCVRADLTVTFAALKPGFARLHAQPVLGEIVVVPIGCPCELLDRLGERVQPPRGHDSPDRRTGPTKPTAPIHPGRTAGDGTGSPESPDKGTG
ncbi:MAG: hydroxyethylthiazole kinase-like uncharacterized protein yjeF [Phycisphaerales bacterium]|jgi:hydroxyethylthiazole kinase-like uncharacterized protein yjeF